MSAHLGDTVFFLIQDKVLSGEVVSKDSQTSQSWYTYAIWNSAESKFYFRREQEIFESRKIAETVLRDYVQEKKT